MAITQSTILPLKYGHFKISYHKTPTGDCLSVSYGNLAIGEPIVRVHASCLFGEAFHGLDCDCAAQLASSLKLVKRNKSGVVVYRYAEGRGIGLENKVKALEVQRTCKVNTVEAFKILGFKTDERTYDVEVAALQDLGLSTRIKVATQNPKKLAALEQAGFVITEQINPAIKLTKYNIPELLTKKYILGYLIDLKLEAK